MRKPKFNFKNYEENLDNFSKDEKLNYLESSLDNLIKSVNTSNALNNNEVEIIVQKINNWTKILNEMADDLNITKNELQLRQKKKYSDSKEDKKSKKKKKKKENDEDEDE